MELIINLDNIKENSKRKFLLQTLKFLGVDFKTNDAQTLEAYNEELENADEAIESRNYTTMDDLLKEMEKW